MAINPELLKDLRSSDSWVIDSRKINTAWDAFHVAKRIVHGALANSETPETRAALRGVFEQLKAANEISSMQDEIADLEKLSK